MFEYVLYQQLKTPSGPRTFFKLFASMLPPAIGWSIQQFSWNEEGHKIEDVYINPLGVCFVGLEKLSWQNDAELLKDYLEDFSSWIEEKEDSDEWRMSLEWFKSRQHSR